MVLYTDGLIEVPGSSIQARQEQVKITLAAHRDVPMEEFMDTLLRSSQEKRNGQPDDICVIGIDV
ncbi:SpoIIE family protein phosphatase [Paenibacillus hexagrammi]|uniref:SpoIIE family protein phosphatase n=1 Tax=Paenibacillus hexagrammi TaxID=2908839 RepID=UPI0033130612